MTDTSGVDQSGLDTSGGNPIGDFFSSIGSGLSNLFSGGGGGSDLASLASQAFGGGTPGNAASQTNAMSAAQDVIDPSTAAQTAISGGQSAPQNQQSQNPQGNQQQQTQNQQQQFAPQSAIDALKKALTNLNQQQRQNPYQLGGSEPNTGPGGSMLNRASRIPTGAVPPMPPQVPPNLFDDSQGSQEADLPSADAQNVEFANDNPPPPKGVDPADAVRAGLRTNAPDTNFRIPGQPANENTPSMSFGDFLNKMRGNVTEPPTPIEGLPPAGDPSSLVPSLGGLAGLAKRLGLPLNPYEAGVGIAMTPTPLQQATGVELPRTLGRSPSGPAQDPFQQPAHPPSTGRMPKPDDPPLPKKGTKPGPKDPQKRKHPDLPPDHPKNRVPTGHYEPATGNARDKQWVKDQQADANLPTKKGPQGPQSSPGSIMRDMSGYSASVPQGLGDLAKMAIPLMLPLLMGGFGGGGRGHGRTIGRGFGHPGGFGRFGGFHTGGSGRWPYHHPQQGWAMHGAHPGGMWRPMSPDHAREFGGHFGRPVGPLPYTGGGGGGMDSGAIQALTAAMGGGGQQGQGNQQRSGGRQGGNWNVAGAPATQGPWSSNPVLNTLVGAESSGYNSGAPGQGPGGDGGIARGFFNIQTPTWNDFKKNVPGAEQYATADQAPPEIQTQVAMTIPVARFGDRTRAILHRQFGNFDERLTVGQLAAQNGQLPQFAGPGKTQTGGSIAANPDGNKPAPETTQQGPESGDQA